MNSAETGMFSDKVQIKNYKERVILKVYLHNLTQKQLVEEHLNTGIYTLSTWTQHHSY